MADSLMEIGVLDGTGHAEYRVAWGPHGDLVLCHPAQPLGSGLRELEPAERLRLAALRTERPALVVEEADGPSTRYVVLVDEPVDLERHVPLGPTDAELLSNVQASARFGRRDDDFLTLTPWNEEDDVLHFSPDDPGFRDVPLVSLDDNGDLTWHRGRTPEQTHLVIRLQLRREDATPDERFGVLTNPFGEYLCIREGATLLPHEDLRRQALVSASGLLDGATALPDAAKRLRAFANRLDAASDAGWTLMHPVVEDLIVAEVGHPANG
ncbi:MAG: hypothetical protein GEU74_04005 [Nitriliruptorales bacterium]|nr:hypothetical protein [Nitriliruptorales bacterium]